MKGWTPNTAANARKPPATPRKPTAPTTTSAAPVAGEQGQEITFPGRVPGLNGQNGLLRMHWSTKKKLLDLYMLRVKCTGLRPHAGPVRLELIRYSIGRQMDYDNLVSTGKLLVDALVRCGVLPDDNPAVLVERQYTQEWAASHAAQRTVLRLTDL